jgi:hypothetical protein
MKGKIFNAHEVQAIIAGNKTMFREVLKTQTKTNEPLNLAYTTPYRTWEWGNSGVYVEEPYEVGQKIFVKESFNIFASQVSYKQGLVGAERYFWKTAQHMKQEHSRLTLEITDIKVERLQSISQEDCAKEGIAFGMWQANGRFFSAPGEPIEIGFAKNWNATHKKPEEKFEVNPFVWVVDFKINK